ncbi:hypothetical protein [Azomonas macrocytogenes]|uniref:Phage shock protein PspC (Stress-responsive transcriptional regulator) n=1 Tax=Azomonas macrocytogenes TaxID=69962 RepID=A0A839T7T4_AZOMA|nr:hypothetical protein [Azomonas macrocytogenes]MBB3105159.1 phage shock protein PspC (stress-responsive transcriptional regulator) [Azomonas macrocytogenes]
MLVYAVLTVIGSLTIVGIIGYFVASHLDKKHEAKLKAKAH